MCLGKIRPHILGRRCGNVRRVVAALCLCCCSREVLFVMSVSHFFCGLRAEKRVVDDGRPFVVCLSLQLVIDVTTAADARDPRDCFLPSAFPPRS